MDLDEWLRRQHADLLTAIGFLVEPVCPCGHVLVLDEVDAEGTESGQHDAQLRLVRPEERLGGCEHGSSRSNDPLRPTA